MSSPPWTLGLAALLLYAGQPAGQLNNGVTLTAPKPVRTAPPPLSRDLGAAPRPGVLKTFGDWTVGCDNTLNCELRSLDDDNAPPSGATISVSRAAGPEGQITLSILGEEAGQHDLTPEIDGQAFDSPARVVAAMANARALTVLAAGKTVATVSLEGAAAALRYVDAIQGRAGTVTAIVAKGLKPARAVPAAAGPPTIVALTAGGEAATPTEAQIDAMRHTAGCDEISAGGLETAALGGGETLVLLPCFEGAYNMSSALFILDRKGAQPAQADAPPPGSAESSGGGPPVSLVVNGDWANGVVSSYAKGRGLGDCGLAQEWVWDGARLRLSSQSEMNDCRGNSDFIMTWRATVVRR